MSPIFSGCGAETEDCSLDNFRSHCIERPTQHASIDGGAKRLPFQAEPAPGSFASPFTGLRAGHGRRDPLVTGAVASRTAAVRPAAGARPGAQRPEPRGTSGCLGRRQGLLSVCPFPLRDAGHRADAIDRRSRLQGCRKSKYIKGKGICRRDTALVRIPAPDKGHVFSVSA